MWWLAAALVLSATSASAASFSDGGNTFLSYACSTTGLYSPNCAEYPHPSIPEPISARGVVNSLGAFDVDYFNSGVFGGFFAENLELEPAAILAVRLPTLVGTAAIEYSIGITQAERSHGDPSWSTTLFDVSWTGTGWTLGSINAHAAPQVIGNVVYFSVVEYPSGPGSTIATIFGGRSAEPFQALGLALVPEPSVAGLSLAGLALVALRLGARSRGWSARPDRSRVRR